MSDLLPNVAASVQTGPNTLANTYEFGLFSCRMCGHCCHGTGGIVVGPRDLPRLSAHFQLSDSDFLASHTEIRDNKPMLKTGDDGYCAFFRAGTGCAIHYARPNVCRAWPYFRGNLIDDISFAMAREDCPGIKPHAPHATFAREGFEYLRQNDLLAHDPTCEGRALIVREDELPSPHCQNSRSGQSDGQSV